MHSDIKPSDELFFCKTFCGYLQCTVMVIGCDVNTRDPCWLRFSTASHWYCAPSSSRLGVTFSLAVLFTIICSFFNSGKNVSLNCVKVLFSSGSVLLQLTLSARPGPMFIISHSSSVWSPSTHTSGTELSVTLSGFSVKKKKKHTVNLIVLFNNHSEHESSWDDEMKGPERVTAQ